MHPTSPPLSPSLAPASSTDAGPLEPRGRIAVLCFVLSVVAALPLLWLHGRHGAVGHPVGVAGLAAAFALARQLVFHTYVRKQAITHSPFEIPLAVGIVLLAPLEVAVARLIGALPDLLRRSNTEGFKRRFNLAKDMTVTAVSILLFHLLSALSGGGIGQTWLALVAALSVGSILGLVLVLIAAAVFEWRRPQDLHRSLVDAPFLVLPLVAFSVTVAVPAQVDWRLGLVALTSLPLVWLTFRSHTELLGRYTDLSNLHDFTRRMGDLLDLTDVAEEAAHRVADQLRAEAVVVRLWTDDRFIDVGAGVEGSLLPAHPDDTRWHADLEDRRPLRCSELTSEIRSDLDAAGHSHALIAPLGDEEGPLGVIVIDGRRHVSPTFGDDDLRRLGTMAQQLSVVVRKCHLHQRIAFEAAHDRLTGLPNRSHYEQRIGRAIDRGEPGAVLLIDLDRFKQINDTFGHHAGDVLLIEVARRIEAVVGPGDVTARFGGDEYAAFCPGLDASAALALAESVCIELERAFDLGPATVAIGASVGVALLGHHGGDAASLLRSADLAMYDAKNRRVRARLYHEALTTDTAERLTMLDDLRTALRNGEIDVHFQPQLDLETGIISGAESLARWEHPRHGRVAPDVFIELAEQSGLIEELTRQVMDQALSAAASWHAAGQPLQVSINISAQSLMDEGLESLVAERLIASGVDPSLVVLEITETTMMGDASQVYANLAALTDLGVCLSVDDFGTGFSSLVNLRRLDVDEIKIDKSFVMQMMLEHEDEVIVRSTIELGHNLGLTVVAEGVETSEAMARLRELGCDTVQGYGLSRPLPRASFERWLSERATTAEAARFDLFS